MCFFGRGKITRLVFKGFNRFIMSAGETPADWDKCPHKWEPMVCGTSVLVGPSGLNGWLQVGESLA